MSLTFVFPHPSPAVVWCYQLGVPHAGSAWDSCLAVDEEELVFHFRNSIGMKVGCKDNENNYYCASLFLGFI
jgi:hypothetical protein